ncbi:MAG: hypothetical protein OXC31_28650 [Spirochaetaceae bacterium]|nr:hypothetical protein [Spirochaetaceae bacterium]
MRKIALLTMPLLVLGLFSLSAEEMEMMGPTVNSPVTAEVSGSSTLTWGIDLATNSTGFTNTHAADLKITIVPEQSTNTGMMDDSDDLYAYIELNTFKWEVTSADGQGKTTAPSIVTKLFMGPLSITTYAKPEVKIDYVDTVDGADDTGVGDKEDEFPGKDFPDVETVYGSSGGVTVSYDIAPVMLSLGVVSENDWTESKPDPEFKDVTACHTHAANDKGEVVLKKCANEDKDDQNEENAYAFIGTVNLDIGDNADLEATVAYAHEYTTGDDIGIGAEATFNLGDITPVIAFDTSIPSDGDTVPWDVGGSVKWNLSADEESHVSTNLMMHSPTDGDSKLYVSLSLVEGAGDDGALEGMGAELTVGLDDAAGDSDWNAKVAASYLVEGIMPYFDVSFGSADTATTAFKAGLELTMIKHLTTTLEYASTDIETDKGAVTTAFKISY